MAPRLAHTKSRGGCAKCKARKVKCDETHPCCGSCARHGVECEYPSLSRKISEACESSSQSRTDAETSTPDSGSSQTSNGEPDASLRRLLFEADERRLLELRLLHHYESHAVYSFPGILEPGMEKFWTVDAVSLAFKHDFLLHAIFSISALHACSFADWGSRKSMHPTPNSFLASESGQTDNMEHGFVHQTYLDLATQQQRAAVAKLAPENADAIWVASILLSLQTIKLIPAQSPSREYSPPIQWLSMSNAIANIFEACRPFLQQNVLMLKLTNHRGEPDFRDIATTFHPSNRNGFEHLLEWQKYPEPGLDDETQHVYELTLAYVGGIHKAVLEDEELTKICRRVLWFGTIVPGLFVKLLQQRRPRALAILAHLFAIAKCVDDFWLVKGCPEREVHGIQSIMPAEWQWALEWPLKMLKELPKGESS